MNTHKPNLSRELDLEQDVNDFKVVPARKGVENLGFDGDHKTPLFDSSKSMWSPSEKFGSPDPKKSDLSRRFDFQNENDNNKGQSPYARKFSPISSAFRPTDGVFSKTPGPGSKPSKSQFDPIDLQTPSKSAPTDALAFNLFESDDHTWTQARNTLQTELQEPSMTPLMNSMLGQFLDTSPVPTYRNSYKHSPEATNERHIGADADLDIRNLAKNFDAVMFQSSLSSAHRGSNTHSFGLSDSASNTAVTTSSSLTDPLRVSREVPLFPLPGAFAVESSQQMDLADMHFEIDRLSQPSSHTSQFGHSQLTSDYPHSVEIDERPTVWNPSDSFGLSQSFGSGTLGPRVGSGVSHSLPHMPPYYGSGVGTMQHMQGSLLNNDSDLNVSHHVNNVHNSWNGTSLHSARNTHFDNSSTTGFEAQQALHQRTGSGNAPIYGDVYSNQPYFAPKLQNWMDPTGSSAEQYHSSSGVNPLQGSVSNVDDFNALSSNLADQFARHNNSTGRASSSSSAYSNPAHLGHHTTPLNQQSQFGAGPQFNAAAPAFRPKQYGEYNAEHGTHGEKSSDTRNFSGGSSMSGVNSNRDSWDNMHTLQNSHHTNPPISNHTTHQTLPAPNALASQGMPGLRPPQTHYEPPLPTTTGIRVGKARNASSYELRGSGSGSISGNNSMGSSAEGQLRTSTDSEHSHLSRNRPLHTSNSGGYGHSSNYGGNPANTGVYTPYTTYNSHLNANSNTHPTPPPYSHPAHTSHPMHGTYATHGTTHPSHSSVHTVKEVNKNAFPRVEIVESAQGKQYYKEFHRVFLNLKEKHEIGYSKQRKHALLAIEAGPQDVKWRIHLDLADLYKRNNYMDEARQHYAQVCRLQPRAATGWLEWSKMDEENGKIRVALDILLLGLKVCTANEALLTKAIKLNERLHKYSDARGMLSKLKYESIDKVWKSVLEGALFEARTGNVHIARKLFKYLISHVPWYGPIYFEAFRLEEKEHRDDAAYEIILKGLNELPRYGPLWFGLFRIMERRDATNENRAWQQGVRPRLENILYETSRAVRLISKELTWKVHFERSQCEERAAEVAALGKHLHTHLTLQQCRDEMLCDARLSLTRSLLTCPGNLRWRVLLVGARLELGVGAIDKARALLRRAAKEVPVKSKSYVYLECSRVEEYCGNLDTARVLLARAKKEQEGEWKLFLESVLVEARAGLIERAAAVALEAVQAHDGTGRLWAIYIQLCHRLEARHFYDTEVGVLQSRLNALCSTSGDDGGDIATIAVTPADQLWLSKSHVVLQAITQVPKSGEVWCERGRCHLNPLSPHCFDLSQAQRSLCFAIQFTPQYGDTFVEYVRLELLCQVLLPRVLELLGLPVLDFVRAFLSEDPEADVVEITRDTRRVSLHYSDDGVAAVPCSNAEKTKRERVIVELERMQFEIGDLSELYAQVVIKNLNRRSVNADPNYGSAWFHCRQQPYDTPSTVLNTALSKLVHEVSATQAVYARAMLHYIRRCLLDRGGVVRGDVNSSSSVAVNVDSEVNAILSSPTRSSSVPAGRTKSAHNGTNGDIGALDVTKSLEGSRSRAANVPDATSSTARNTPSPYALTAMGGRHSPLRDAALHATSPTVEVESGVMRAEREAELLLQIAEVNSEMLRLRKSSGGEVSEVENTAASSSAATPGAADTATALPVATRNTSHWTSLNTVHITPFVDLDNGALYCSTDFITGVIEMNRSMYNNNLSDEVRRKNLFGSDQIIS